MFLNETAHTYIFLYGKLLQCISIHAHFFSKINVNLVKLEYLLSCFAEDTNVLNIHFTVETFISQKMFIV